ncbi:NAD(P)/FAD-dependent oxidoreductase [Streptomyces sp. NPDC005141]
MTPIPCETFVRYGMWFAQRYVGPVEAARVTAVERSGAGFTVRLEGGGQIEAAAVVVASGLATFAYVPDALLPLAPGGPGHRLRCPTRASTPTCPGTRGSGWRWSGGGQSALESAALLHEAGADVEVLVRDARVNWVVRPQLQQPLGQRLVAPASALGTGWALAAVCGAPGAVRRLPAAARMQLFRGALGPSGGWWLRERVEGVVPVHTECCVERARRSGAEVHLRLGGRGSGPADRVVDHVLAATGYRLDVDALPFLMPSVRRAVGGVPGSQAPRLSGAFESSVAGLYFTGSLAAPMFGPMLRFMAGTEFAARRIAGRLVRQAPRR